MAVITLYAKQKKRHRCIEQTFGPLWYKVRVGCFERTALKRVLPRVKQITSPGWMHGTGAQAWCTGRTRGVWLGMGVGGGDWIGITLGSMADSCQCVTGATAVL